MLVLRRSAAVQSVAADGLRLLLNSQNISGQRIDGGVSALRCARRGYAAEDSDGSDSEGLSDATLTDAESDVEAERPADKQARPSYKEEEEDPDESLFRHADSIANWDIDEIIDMVQEGMTAEELRDLSFSFNHLIKVGRHIKVTAGGRMQSYSALVLIGNEMGSAGLGYGKALSPMLALKNANQDAFKNVISVPLFEDRTIPVPELTYKYRATKFHIRGCPVGHGRAAHGLLGLACEAFGFQDIFAKSYGSRNEHNVLRGFFEALSSMQSADFYAAATGRAYFNHKAIWRDRPYVQAY